MKRVFPLILCACTAMTPGLARAGHGNLSVPPSQTFLLGGEQSGVLAVSGTNLGPTDITILARKGDIDTTITTVAPGASFKHDFAVGEIALVANPSGRETARLSVDFTGPPSSLTMRYIKRPR